MKVAKAYFGFLPAALVAIPCAVAAIRQALCYQGCMDGLGFVMVAFVALVAGGALNAAFLAYVGWTRRRYFDFAERRHVIAAKTGVALAAVLFIAQVAIVLFFWIGRRIAAA